MGSLIRNGEVVSDDTTLTPLDGFLSDDNAATGVLLDADDEVETIAERLDQLSVIALDFPVFSDGRAYSSAAMLRRHYNFQGEIRAVGDVRVDQLEQMVRCGFDAFELADGQDTELALSRLGGFSHSYQQTIDREPLFRQR